MAAGMAAAARRRLAANLSFKDAWQEASGSLGDLGTFVPIVVALTLVRGLDLGTSLLFTGAYNVITGVAFGVPMPVQPMKSIAAAAIASELTLEQVMAAGICVSGIALFLGATRGIRLVAWLVPLPVVRGIQLAQGLSFAVTASKYVLKQQDLSRGGRSSGADRPWLGTDGLILALFSLAFIVLVNGADASSSAAPDPVNGGDEEGCQDTPAHSNPNGYLRRVPTAMVIFLLGIVLAFVRKPSLVKQLRLGPSVPRVMRISGADWKTGFIHGAVPQLPLTILNSVVAVCNLSADLFPAKAETVTPSIVSTSVGAMNLVGCWFGALPVCHGAGGLAGQYKFGATSGASVAMLGAAKLLLGLILGTSLVAVLQPFPVGILGVLLLFSGLELAMACRDMSSRLDALVMLTCVALSQAANLALGCVAAIVLFAVVKAREVGPVELYRRLRAAAAAAAAGRRASRQDDDGDEQPAGYRQCPPTP